MSLNLDTSIKTTIADYSLGKPIDWNVSVTGPHQSHSLQFRIPEENCARLPRIWFYEEAARQLNIPISRFQTMPTDMLLMCPIEYPITSRHMKIVYL